MTTYSFGTFLVDDSNREAFALCEDVAELRPVSPLPVCILGDEGCGKTHLLYSIVNRVRATSANTGLAYVTAHDFPEQVRALIRDPSPVQRVKSAILLADQLEQFSERVDEFEAVTRIFLDKGHYVIVASNVHPGRLTNLTEGLRSLLVSGQIVSILPQTSETRVELLKRQVRQESEDLINEQRQEIEELQALLKRVGQSGSTIEMAKKLADLRSEVETERTARMMLTRQLDIAKEEGEVLEREVAALRQQLDRAGATRDKQVVELESQLKSLETDKSAAQQQAEQERAQSEAELAQREALEQEIRALREDLHAAQDEAERARDEANQLLDRADELLSVVETHRERFIETEAMRRRQISELEAVLAQHRHAQRSRDEAFEAAERRTSEVLGDIEKVRSQWSRERRELEAKAAELKQKLDEEMTRAQAEKLEADQEYDRAVAEQAGLRADLERAEALQDELRQALAEAATERREVQDALGQAQAERDDLQGVLEKVQGERDTLRTAAEAADAQLEDVREQLDEARRQLDAQSKEMDALRHEAAAQVAAANAQAGELEGCLSRFRAAFEEARRTGQEVGLELQGVTEQLVKTAEAITAASERLASWRDDTEDRGDTPDEDGLLRDESGGRFGEHEGNGEPMSVVASSDEAGGADLEGQGEALEPKVIPLHRDVLATLESKTQGKGRPARESALYSGVEPGDSIPSQEAKEQMGVGPGKLSDIEISPLSGDDQSAPDDAEAQKRPEGSSRLHELQLPAQDANPLDGDADPSS